MSHTPLDDHFISQPDLDLLGHRPHKSAILLFQALTATAVFRIWPSLLFMGGWSAAIVLINQKTEAEMTVPSTLLTALGVLLGLTLSYRTSSAYAQYSEGRKLWTQIIQANRTWARVVWIHCPDAIRAAPPDDPQEGAHEETRAVIEKATLVRMGLAFAVAVKHYLRGEEGILYEDLYDLVKYIPSLHLPSGIASAEDANIAIGRFPSQHKHKHSRSSSITNTNTNTNTTSNPNPDVVSSSTELKSMNHSDGSLGINVDIPLTATGKSGRKLGIRPTLHPARDPPKFRFSETFPFKWLVTKRQRYKAAGRMAMRERMREQRSSGGVGQNVPLEITMFMSSWIANLQKRKTIDVPTTNSLLAALLAMSEALSNLERILTTPIPFTYSAQIWEVTWIYCLVLPFQLYGAGFGWITIPAVVITSYIVLGFAEIGSEIENPFGYDKNDLNLDFFTNNIIREELAAITARPFSVPDEWIFVGGNDTLGRVGVGADELLERGLGEVRNSLAALSGEKGQHAGLKGRARSPV
ncbi:uncharacterized protein I303_107423 [Kwoniella dejecticola CBS 10117]|uniref:Uncharacterized protein n=1 Tax=Kwoniella dejecticola CBS 10117 TaxID=1296121 RepID=A0A1A5ZZN6_9TREE|nr:uncharacterized protein I303_06827 [Kwoniella dejecticola CBS 10117]OBR83264.1 hypothetical protein I303_06827 [Kwoniella dejecticola CBS 10117]